MEGLNALEQKIITLVTLSKDLKEQNIQLKADNQLLKAENSEVRSENAKLLEDNAQLIAKIEAVEGSVLKGNEEIEKLSYEQSSVKSVVDELIQSIDAIVEIENQQ